MSKNVRDAIKIAVLYAILAAVTFPPITSLLLTGRVAPEGACVLPGLKQVYNICVTPYTSIWWWAIWISLFWTIALYVVCIATEDRFGDSKVAEFTARHPSVGGPVIILADFALAIYEVWCGLRERVCKLGIVYASIR